MTHQLQHMAVFAAVAETQSFAGAARKLRMSAPAVTRAVATLERSLRVKLLTRSTRHVRVTDAGLQYLEATRRILSDVQAAEDTARGINATPTGTLMVTAPVVFGRRFVMPVINDFLARYPETSVTAMFDDRVTNLLEESIDVGIRVGELKNSEQNAMRIGSTRRVVCASPAYVKSRGTPATPSELTLHSVISAATVSPTTEWQFAATPASVRIKPRLTVTNNDAALAACLDGVGIIRLFSYQVHDYVHDGRLVLLLEDFQLDPLPIHVLYRGGRQASANVRAFVDLAAAHIKPELAKQR